MAFYCSNSCQLYKEDNTDDDKCIKIPQICTGYKMNEITKFSVIYEKWNAKLYTKKVTSNFSWMTFYCKWK